MYRLAALHTYLLTQAAARQQAQAYMGEYPDSLELAYLVAAIQWLVTYITKRIKRR